MITSFYGTGCCEAEAQKSECVKGNRENTGPKEEGEKKKVN